MKIYIILFLLLLLVPSCQQETDSSDKAALKRHFEIPNDAEMVVYDGFPPMSGFGQREGLSISAKYKLNDQDMFSWINTMQAKGLKELPVEPQCRSKLWFKDKLIKLDTQTGYYYCGTAGNDVLNATETKSCDDVDLPPKK